jgi:D-galacturonate reductase
MDISLTFPDCFLPHCCRAWAGKASDISFYLNSHHIDIHNWSVGSFASPVRVVAMASNGVAKAKLGEARGRDF